MRSVLLIFVIFTIIGLEYCLWKIFFSKNQEEIKKNKNRFFLIIIVVFIVAMKIYFS